MGRTTANVFEPGKKLEGSVVLFLKHCCSFFKLYMKILGLQITFPTNSSFGLLHSNYLLVTYTYYLLFSQKSFLSLKITFNR